MTRGRKKINWWNSEPMMDIILELMTKSEAIELNGSKLKSNLNKLIEKEIIIKIKYTGTTEEKEINKYELNKIRLREDIANITNKIHDLNRIRSYIDGQSC